MYTEVSAKILPGDIVVATGSVRYEHTSPEYAPIEYTAVADFDVALALRTTSEMQSSALFVVANALNVRCGSCFHVIWNQEREKAGLFMSMTEDSSGAVKVGIEAVKKLIMTDRNRK